MVKVVTGHYEHWSLKIDENNILWLLFDRADSGVNSLNEATLKEFEQILNGLSQNNKVKALIIRSAKKTGFIVGADIAQFKTLTSSEEATQLIKRGQDIFSKLESLSIPTIALIEGYCLGGGLELALACRYRITDDSLKTKLGLPEVKLGIHPGWGGTVRLPKLIGALKAMDVILSGRNLSAKAAKKMGIVDEVIPTRLLEKVATFYALTPPVQKKNRIFNCLMEMKLLRPMLGRLFYYQLQKKVNIEHYPSPYKVVDNWIELGANSPQAMSNEAQSIGKLLVSDTARNLARVFYLQDTLKALSKGIDFKPKHVHVIGSGVMGGDIAAWCVLRGFHVTLQDQAAKLIGNAVKRTFELVQKQLKEDYLVTNAMDRLLPDPTGIGATQADVIIEAISEKLEAKQNLFSTLERVAKKDAILATNTSTIPLEEIATVLKDPKRLVGIHFFNPVAKMPLVEVVYGEKTDKQVIQYAVAFVRKIDKLPLIVKSSPGFLVNRILMPYMLEAVTLLEEGVSANLIDAAAMQFGMPMGPIELADTVGLDICLAALERLAQTEGLTVPQKLKDYVARGELGRKTGKGFYQYHQGKPVKPSIKQESIPSDISHRLTLRIYNEAIACLREGIVESPDMLDAGCIFGFGFPPFTGGPIHLMQSQGKEIIVKLLEEFQARYGNRFAPDKGWRKQLGVESV